MNIEQRNALKVGDVIYCAILDNTDSLRPRMIIEKAVVTEISKWAVHWERNPGDGYVRFSYLNEGVGQLVSWHTDIRDAMKRVVVGAEARVARARQELQDSLDHLAKVAQLVTDYKEGP